MTITFNHLHTVYTLYLVSMKRFALLLLLVCTATVSFCQEKTVANPRSPKEVQRRIDELLRSKQYASAPDGFDLGVLSSRGTVIVKDTATNTLGKLKKKSKKKYKTAYLVRYSIGADKIVSIAPPKKKKKRFLLF